MSEATYERIESEISSDSSPVGIDALKTHVLIIAALERLERQVAALDRRLARLEPDAPGGP